MQQAARTSRYKSLIAGAREKLAFFQEDRLRPATWIVAAAALLAILYLARLAPFSYWVRIPLALAMAALTSYALFFVFGKLISRYHSGKSLILELLLSLVMLALLVLDGAGLPILFWLSVAPLLLLSYFLRRRNLFALSFSGLTLFVLVYTSFLLVDLQKATLVGIYQSLWKSAAEEEIGNYTVKEDAGRVSVSDESGSTLELSLGTGMHLHTGDAIKAGEGPGLTLLGISQDANSMDRLPSALLYAALPGMDRQTLRNRTELMLGSLPAETVEDLKKEKEQSLYPPDFPIQMSGSFWTYYDRFQASTLRTGFFVFSLESKTEVRPRTFVLWILEPLEEGFPFHPRTLELLRSMRWTGQYDS
ncbi:MAG: hypothetical protein KDK23_08120 [Leptospiraceae bacterium]|nr:hypothetical protein [Leptospiraceae bacterium]